MWSRRSFNLLLNASTCSIIVLFLTTSCLGVELSETDTFINFVRAVDPQNVLKVSWNAVLPHPCSQKWKGVIKCNSLSTAVTEIRLENLNLSGVIDSDSLCSLKSLQVVSLAKNFIHGNIPYSMLYCRRLTYLNRSNNLLGGRLPVALTKLKHLRTLDISNNYFESISPSFRPNFRHLVKFSVVQSAAHASSSVQNLEVADHPEPPRSGNNTVSAKEEAHGHGNVKGFLPLILAAVCLILISSLACYAIEKISQLEKEKQILKSLAISPAMTPLPPAVHQEELKHEKVCSELIFFVEEQQRFELDELFEAAADLRSQTLCSSLFVIKLHNDAIYAVKRLKSLKVSCEDFSLTMKHIGHLKHPNILPLIAYNCTNDKKLLIYDYQSNGSLLKLFQDYIERKRDFPWILRLSIVSGVARGLAFIYQNPDICGTIPHGNLKLSNILLDQNEEPLISEYGLSRLLDTDIPCLLTPNGYSAPEKTLSEKSDVYGFGIILLQLLTGKAVEPNGIQLPKWVRSMVREEWTGEVFDREVGKAAQYAFPLLNIALKCVSHSPHDRPSTAEVMEQIEEIVCVHDEISISSMGSGPTSPRDFSLLHDIIPESWDTTEGSLSVKKYNKIKVFKKFLILF